MIAPLHDEFLLIRNGSPFLLVACAANRFSLCIATASEEYFQTIDPGDLIVVSAPEGGELEAGVILIELIRRHHTPLIVLPGSHPASRQLRYVVSAGPVVETNCSIQRGTHPEQHLICASAGLAGITLKGTEGSVEIGNLPEGAGIERFRARTVIERC